MNELIVKGANVHFISAEARTPFLCLFDGLEVAYHWESPKDEWEPIEPTKLMRSTTNDLSEPNGWTATMTRKIHMLLNTWLVCLQESGVDLEEYGRTELEYFQRGLVSWIWLSDLASIDGKWFFTILTYGPSPSDWEIDIEWCEAPPENPGKMPGGWIDDDGSNAEDDDLSEDELSGYNLSCDEDRIVDEEPQA